MANWLEEERKRSLLLQREEAAHNQLRMFYDLSNRVNRVKPNSLSVSRLKIEGQRTFTISEMQDDGDGGRMGVWGKRGIRVSCTDKDETDETLVDVIISEHHHNFDRVDRKSTRLNSSHLGISY